MKLCEGVAAKRGCPLVLLIREARLRGFTNLGIDADAVHLEAMQPLLKVGAP